MSDLLAWAVDAHGGTHRWDELQTLQADLTISGYTFVVKQQAEVFRQVTVSAQLHEERIELDPASFEGRHTVFDGRQLVMHDAACRPVEVWDDPAAQFSGHSFETPWTKMHAAYFSSEALWTYLTMPFLFTYPGFAVEEIEPWHEDDEVWRSLRVTFPDYIVSHHREQIARFGPDGLLRRHDYVVDILPGAAGANYAHGYRNIDGIMFPTQRRIYAYDEVFVKVPDPILVAFDILDISLQ
jgi:hypothetical protein